MAFVQKSIITMALGLDSMQRSICPLHKPGLCREMLPVNGSTLLQHLMNVSFSFLNEQVYFDEQGDPPGKYEILNFQRRRKSSSNLNEPPVDSANTSTSEEQLDEQRRKLKPMYDSYKTLRLPRRPSRSSQQLLVDRYSSSSHFEYVHVGSWKSSDGLSLFGDIHWPSRSSPEDASSSSQQQPHQLEMPRSVCSLPCAKGHAKVSISSWLSNQSLFQCAQFRLTE